MYWLDEHRVWMIGAVGVLSALLALGLNASRWKIFATVVVALVLLRAYPSDDGRVETVRSFFGVHKIVVTPNGQYHVLMHGTTIHGAEKFKNDDGTPVDRAARADHLLPQGRRHRSGDHGDPRAQGRAAAGGGDRARLRHADLRLGAGRGLEILRDRPDDGRYRARSEIFHLHPELRAEPEARDRRCAADLRARARRHLRPDHRRRLFVGRDPDPSGDRRGDGDLQGKSWRRRARW